MLTLFAIDENFIVEITGHISSVFDDLKLLILLIIGLFVGFFVVERVIEIMLARTKK